MKKKGFVRLDELATKCKCRIDDLLHEAASGNLKLSIPFFGVEQRNFHFLAPLDNCDVSADQSDSGVFDLHLENARELVQSKSAVVEDIFSPGPLHSNIIMAESREYCA